MYNSNKRIHLDNMKNMAPKTAWRVLDDNLLIDIPNKRDLKENVPARDSLEKKRQFLREREIPPVVYFFRDL